MRRDINRRALHKQESPPAQMNATTAIRSSQNTTAKRIIMPTAVLPRFYALIRALANIRFAGFEKDYPRNFFAAERGVSVAFLRACSAQTIAIFRKANRTRSCRMRRLRKLPLRRVFRRNQTEIAPFFRIYRRMTNISPRGDLPVVAKISGYRFTAYHLTFVPPVSRAPVRLFATPCGC